MQHPGRVRATLLLTVAIAGTAASLSGCASRQAGSVGTPGDASTDRDAPARDAGGDSAATADLGAGPGDVGVGVDGPRVDRPQDGTGIDAGTGVDVSAADSPGAVDATADRPDGAIARTDGPPFTVQAGLYDQTKPNDLGLPVAAGTETITIFRPSAATDHYSNGVVMVAFKGWLYAQWQSSAQDEDAPDTWLAYSRSQDGISWSPPMTLAERWDQGIRTSGGWWVDGDALVAYVNVWPSATVPRGGFTEYTTSTDGVTWSARKSLPMASGTPMNAIFEQDPRALPEGRILGAAHFQPGLLAAPCYTDDPSGLTGWTRAIFQNLPHTGDVSRELEPSWFRRADGALVMVFRDQNASYRRLASVSADRGATWTAAVLTDMPDSRAKQSAGNLPDGAAYQVGNPVPTNIRIPLVVSLSRDGLLFDKAFALRRGGSDLQALRYPGTAKSVGYSYPKSMVWQGSLYVAYSTNKEDVEYTRVPLTALGY
jgi:hypothetical protein